mgnify:CR=1 FL=1|tara:strand:- start:94 stop:741 length:648 start_codon:yes stop_codon:yes gene_type:complete
MSDNTALQVKEELLEAIDVDEDILRNPSRYAPEKYKRRRLTKKQQKFVQLYVHNDLTNTECAHRAGYSHPAQSASMLLNDPRFLHIQETIKDLQEGYQKKYEITFEKVARDLQMIRDAAVEDGKFSAAVQAELGRAKLAGLMVEKKEIKHGRIDQMDRDEVEARLRKLIESNQLAPQLEERVFENHELEGSVEPHSDIDHEDLNLEQEQYQIDEV